MPNPNGSANADTTALLPDFITKPPVFRQRRPSPRRRPDPNPTIREGIMDGRAVVFLGLGGARGEGHEAIVDGDAWSDIERRHGAAWVLNQNGTGMANVRKGGNALAAAARQNGERPTATLARIIAGAKPGERVTYRNGNRLDLRRNNLIVHNRDDSAKHRARFAERRAA